MIKETIGPCELYLGDCRDILPFIQAADATITDPPYGVLLGEVKNGDAMKKGQIPYETFSDTPEYIQDVVVPVINICLNISKRALITPGGRNMWAYPKPDDWGVWYNPAGTSRGRWGFILAHPILYYGRDPKIGKGQTPSSVPYLSGGLRNIKNILHPCPKPLKFMNWAVNKASLEGELVLDPFMGSGTTGVACINLKRRFIGIEIEKKYFDFACKQIEAAAAQKQFDFGGNDL
jgi:site-specific DNA-methyltransferase (adenine-specific)/modification methylase